MSPDFPVPGFSGLQCAHGVAVSGSRVEGEAGAVAGWFIPLGALAKPDGNGNGAEAPKPEIAEPVACSSSAPTACGRALLLRHPMHCLLPKIPP